ncbi:hypothetical protein C5C07_19230 [Haloferax sp. Atlit-4N]|uniref:AAA family ATPase n=1 Tax=Haloferax sp. Atlit-4N TaxID=2077206 RepID=UPI000E2801DC|nr:AAA family ATPase [Haloferax sp. Atlit-4N]RDZ50456.1 hypothetical protein C5C07_19230 [Haloferax sp. Atlit-4N]
MSESAPSVFLQPVGDDWIGWFEKTVHTPFDFTTEQPPDELKGYEQARIWGFPEGEKNDSYWEQIAPGDLILFYRNDVFFAVATVAETIQSKDVGEHVWNNAGSKNVFVLENYKLLGLPVDRLWELLDFKSNFRLQGFMRAKQWRVQRILEEGYTSVAAFLDTYTVSEPAIPTLGAAQRSINDEWDAESRIQHVLDRVRDVEPATPEELLEKVRRESQEPEDEAFSTYFVNQRDEAELEGSEDPNVGYLKAGVDDVWHHDLSQLAAGDIVFHYHDGALVAISEVVGTASIINTNGSNSYIVPVRLARLGTPLEKAELTKRVVNSDLVWGDLPFFIAPKQGYLIDINRQAARTLVHIVSGKQPKTALESYLEFPTVDFELPDALYFDDAASIRRDIEAALNAGKHIILTGPPGTGKSKIAKAIATQATELQEVDGSRFITATSDMTTYDTIGGYVPNRAAEGDELEFRPRQFLRCFRDNGVHNEWLIIDEINRADIDKAFGQLFSVLSGDSVELPYENEETVTIEWVDDQTPPEERRRIETSPDRYPVTPSWRLLATMNTQDKTSLYEMSFAFMRRFNFIHIGLPELTQDGTIRASLLDPDQNVGYARGWAGKYSGPGDFRETLANGHADIAVIWAVINRERALGPSIIKDITEYLTAYKGSFREGLTRAVIGQVFPQLEGLRPQTQESLLVALEEAHDVDTHSDPVTPDLNFETLYRKANDFFGVDIGRDDD